MKYVRLRLHFGDQPLSPLRRALIDSENVELARLRFGGVTATGDRTYVFSITGGVDSVLPTLSETDGVYGVEVLDRDDDSGLLYARTETTDIERRIQAAFNEESLVSGVPVDLYPDGSTVLRVIGEPADLQHAIETVRETISVTVERIGEYDRPSQRITATLTDRQVEAVEAALTVGYYDVPRTATHEDVAAELDCAPSTASEHLRKAESALVRTVFRGQRW